jgi:uncharacterized sporulation protein YeaH/YhbH (DUF444 family)
MAAPRKYDDHTRKRILELHVHERRSASETAKILERDGTPISIHSVREIAKQERRTDITNRPKAEQLASLLAGLVTATNSEIARINAKNQDVDGDQLLKLARTIREIEPLLTDKKPKKDKQPSGLLGNLGQDSNAATPKPSGGTSAAVRSLAA